MPLWQIPGRRASGKPAGFLLSLSPPIDFACGMSSVIDWEQLDMIADGFTEDEIRTMAVANTRRLAGLEPIAFPPTVVVPEGAS